MKACGGRIIPVNELAQLSCFAVTLSAATQNIEQIMSSLIKLRVDFKENTTKGYS